MRARAALWLLGADSYGKRFWQRLREEVADAPIAPVSTTARNEASAILGEARPGPPTRAIIKGNTDLSWTDNQTQT